MVQNSAKKQNSAKYGNLGTLLFSWAAPTKPKWVIGHCKFMVAMWTAGNLTAYLEFYIKRPLILWEHSMMYMPEFPVPKGSASPRQISQLVGILISIHWAQAHWVTQCSSPMPCVSGIMGCLLLCCYGNHSNVHIKHYIWMSIWLPLILYNIHGISHFSVKIYMQ